MPGNVGGEGLRGPLRRAFATVCDMRIDRQDSDVFASRRQDYGLSRLRVGPGLGVIGQRENSWPVTESLTHVFPKVFL